jgi:hypothetical protein
MSNRSAIAGFLRAVGFLGLAASAVVVAIVAYVYLPCYLWGQACAGLSGIPLLLAIVFVVLVGTLSAIFVLGTR